MADYLKNPLGRSLNELAAERARQAIEQTGKALPCSVASVVSSGIVTVNFEVASPDITLPQVTVPICQPTYIRYPIQPGDLGMVISADAALGGVTGLGSGLPTLGVQPGNLTALAFVWLGNKNWDAALDPQALELWRNVLVKPSELGFFATPPVAKQTITGPLSSATNAATKAVLTSIIAALVAYGLAIDGTS